MIKKVICFIAIIFLSINVSADTNCPREELNRLKELAKNVSFTYEFNEKTDEFGHIYGDFDIILDNVTKELKPLIIYSWESLQFDEFVPNSNGTAIRKGFEQGKSVKITIKAYVDNGCVAKDLLVKSVKLPYINSFIGSNACKEHPEFKYCINKLMKSNISPKKFDNEYKKYLKSLELGDPDYIIDNTILYIIIAIIVFIPIALIAWKYIIRAIKKKDEI